MFIWLDISISHILSHFFLKWLNGTPIILFISLKCWHSEDMRSINVHLTHIYSFSILFRSYILQSILSLWSHGGDVNRYSPVCNMFSCIILSDDCSFKGPGVVCMCVCVYVFSLKKKFLIPNMRINLFRQNTKKLYNIYNNHHSTPPLEVKWLLS